MKHEYRIVSCFDGQWDLQTRPTKESWAKHYHKSDPDEWPAGWTYHSRGNYQAVVKRANMLIAERDYVPIELTPPFPDKDPKVVEKRPCRKGWF